MIEERRLTLLQAISRPTCTAERSSVYTIPRPIELWGGESHHNIFVMLPLLRAIYTALRTAISILTLKKKVPHTVSFPSVHY